MATLDGINFNLNRLEINTTHINKNTKTATGKRKPIADFGFEGLGLVMEGYANSESEYDNIVAALHSPGTNELIISSGWKYLIADNETKKELMEGVVDYFPIIANIITEDPYKYSVSTKTRTKTITTNNETWTQDDSGDDLSTTGNVDAVPDIKITSRATESTIINQTNYM